MNGRTPGGGNGGGAGPPELPARRKAGGQSKYDYVKVRVWLAPEGPGRDAAAAATAAAAAAKGHYYILSRFLVRRMLTAAGIPQKKAMRISLELKKILVDNNLLDLPQADLDSHLFHIMAVKGFGGEYVRRYRRVIRFYQARVPLMVLICGTACSAKSTIAAKLSDRLNLPSVLQTDVLVDLIKVTEDGPLHPLHVWERDLSLAELLEEYLRESRALRRGLEGDLRKCKADSKALILEGVHLDPGIYLNESESRRFDFSGPRMRVVGGEEEEGEGEGGGAGAGGAGGEGGEGGGDGEGAVKPIVIPIVLTMSEADHKQLLDEWMTYRCSASERPAAALVHRRLEVVQKHLRGFCGSGAVEFRVKLHAVDEVLDEIHKFLLEAIDSALDAEPADGARPGL